MLARIRWSGFVDVVFIRSRPGSIAGRAVNDFIRAFVLGGRQRGAHGFGEWVSWAECPLAVVEGGFVQRSGLVDVTGGLVGAGEVVAAGEGVGVVGADESAAARGGRSGSGRLLSERRGGCVGSCPPRARSQRPHAGRRGGIPQAEGGPVPSAPGGAAPPLRGPGPPRGSPQGGDPSAPRTPPPRRSGAGSRSRRRLLVAGT